MSDEEERSISRREYASLLFGEYKQSERAHFQLGADYGKWLLASLVIVHGGALFGFIAVLADHAENVAIVERFSRPAWALVFGLMSALLSGFCAWINFFGLADSYKYMADPRALRSDKFWFREVPRRLRLSIRWSYWLSVLFGVVSSACLPRAIYLLLPT